MHGRSDTIRFIHTLADVVHLIPLSTYHFSDLNALRSAPISCKKCVCEPVTGTNAVSSAVKCRTKYAPYSAFLEIEPFIDRFINHISQTNSQFFGFWKHKRLVLTPDRYAENPFSVLRNAVVLGIQHFPIVRVAEFGEKVEPFIEVRLELLADKVLDVLKQ